MELDRATGHVTVWAPEVDDDGTRVGEFDDTPSGFGRIAASTARSVIVQKLRDAGDDGRWRVLSDARYLRKEQTARQLGQLADEVLDRLSKAIHKAGVGRELRERHKAGEQP